MSVKKNDISQIKKYLQNELDARTMHQLERRAQDDPFLAEAMEGFENAAPDQHANLADLQERLAERIEPKKERSIWLWRVLPLAACLLIALLIGYEYLTPKAAKQQQLATVIKPEPVPTISVPNLPKPVEAPVQNAPQKRQLAQLSPTAPQKAAAISNGEASAFTNGLTGKVAGLVTYKADTVEYKASNYTVRSNSKAEDVLKRMPGVDVDSAGNVTMLGQAVTKARLNGKDYAGGNVAQAVKNLPADILEKIQVVDDYGDQAARTGIKDGSPTKVLNFTIKPDSSKSKLVAANQPNQNDKALREITIKKAKDSLTAPVAKLNIPPTTKTITGEVIANDGLPLPGVTIRVAGSTQATQTNANGKFTITIPANSTANLQLAAVGFLAQNVKPTNAAMKITMQESANELAEVVVVQDNRGQAKQDIEKTPSQPVGGQKAFDDYLKKNATTDDGQTGSIKVAFTISNYGQPQNIYVVSGKSKALNDKAIELIENGPRWIKGTDDKEVRVNIRFHKP